MRASVRCGVVLGTSRRSGFTLVEIAVVMWALGVLLLVGTALLVGMFKVQHASAAALNDLSVRNALADQFRTDVGGAVAAPDSADPWNASPTCLLVRRADGGHIVYHWNDGHLKRCQLPGGETRWLPVGPDGTAVEFLRPGTDRRVVTLRLSLPRPHSSVASTLEISAALGGDLR